MRVLHVVPSLGPLRGGPSFVARAMAVGLAQAGMSVDVVTVDDNGPGRLAVPLDRPVLDGGVIYRYFPRQTRFYTASGPLAGWLWRNVARYDLVHAHGLFTFAPLAAAAAAAARGVPYILRPLGTLSPYGMRQRRLSKQLSFQLLERHALRAAAAVHFTSEQERQEAAALAVPHSPAVIPLPVALPPSDLAHLRGRFRAAHPALGGATLALFLGRVDPKKGLDLLLPAFAQAHQKQPELALVIAGAGHPRYMDELRSKAAALGLGTEALLWTGFLEGEEKWAALADADFFVLPSYSENFAVAAVEAMAAGLPVLLSDQVGIHHEVTACGAGLVVPCDTQALAAALTQLAADGALRATMGATGRCLAAERFAPQAVTEQLIALYTRILSTSSGR